MPFLGGKYVEFDTFEEAFQADCRNHEQVAAQAKAVAEGQTVEFRAVQKRIDAATAKEYDKRAYIYAAERAIEIEMGLYVLDSDDEDEHIVRALKDIVGMDFPKDPATGAEAKEFPTEEQKKLFFDYFMPPSDSGSGSRIK